MSLLAVDGVSKRFRGLQAVKSVGFSVERGAIVALIGPNGAGKTTTFNMIAGALAPDEGTITLDGKALAGLRPDQVCRAGVARTFQIVRPFGGLTVEDNVIIGAMNASADMAAARARAQGVMEDLGLWSRRGERAASLTLPDRKRLEVARALATNPRLLLLDEVMAGLRPTECDQMIAFFRRVRDSGVTILLIEHVMRAVMALAERIVVLNHGEKIAEGEPARIVRDPAVLACYLGEEAP